MEKKLGATFSPSLLRDLSPWQCPLPPPQPAESGFLERRMTQDSTGGRTSRRLPWDSPPTLTNWAAEEQLPLSSLGPRRDAGWLEKHGVPLGGMPMYILMVTL